MANFRLRFAFSEQGRAAWLSHLEVARALARTLRRAQLPCVLTQGFSPRIKLATGPALPVGVASVAEYADVELSRFVKPAEALARLQAGAPPLLPILGCAYCSPQAPSLDAWLNAQKMELLIPRALRTDDDAGLRSRFEAVRRGPALEVQRKGKVRSYLPADFITAPLEVSERLDASTARSSWAVCFEMRLSGEGALRSDVFAEALLQTCGLALFQVKLTRTALFYRGPDGSCQPALSLDGYLDGC